MLEIEDFKNADEFMERVVDLFKNPTEIAGLLKKCKLSYTLRIWDKAFLDCGIDLIKCAVIKAQGKVCPIEIYNYYKNKASNAKRMLINYLSVKNLKQAQERLIQTQLLDNDFFWVFLNLVYFAIVLLDDDVLCRFKMGITLKKNLLDVGLSGYFEKLHTILPNYLTFYSFNAFFIDPIKGDVKRLKIKNARNKGEILRIDKVKDNGWNVYRVIYKKGFSVDIARENEVFEFEWLNDTELVDCAYDCKSGEEKAAKKKGEQFNNAGWLTVNVGQDTETGHYNYIRAHSLVCLCVYDWDVCKWGLFTSSALSIDHINGKRADNRIENLQMLTRKQNAQKRTDNEGFYFDYFDYFERIVSVCKKETEEHDEWLKRAS